MAQKRSGMIGSVAEICGELRKNLPPPTREPSSRSNIASAEHMELSIGFFVLLLPLPGELGRRKLRSAVMPRRQIPDLYRERRSIMDKDRIEGSAKQIKGKVKETVGKMTGDTKTQAEGKADQLKGKAQNAVGGVKDAIRGK